MLMFIKCVNDKCYRLNNIIKYGIDNGCLFVEIMPEIRKNKSRYITYNYPLSSILYYKVMS